MSDRECAWVGCMAAPQVRGVCFAHYSWTRKAGIKARRGSTAPPRPVEAPYRPMTGRERLDELEWLLNGRVWAPEAVRRCGWSSLKRAAELANLHGRIALAERLRDEMVLAGVTSTRGSVWTCR